MDVHAEKGYAAIRRTWKKGDVIELELPVQPRLVQSSDSVQTIKGKLAIAAGPVVYALEAVDNPGLEGYSIQPNTTLATDHHPGLLNGINVISGTATNNAGQEVRFTAIPFYALGNRQPGAACQVWLPEKSR